MAKVTFKFLGTGNAFSKEYGNTSALVTIENNGTVKNLLIDCGRTTPDDLYAMGHTWVDIDAIFISHLHGDHVYGLEEAGFTGLYVHKKKPHIIFPNQKLKNDLWDKILKGTMMNADGENKNFDDYFTWEAVDRESQYFFFNGVMFSVYSTLHIKNKKSYGLIVGEKNYVIYTADSLINPDFLDIAVSDGCQMIFHDCGFYDGEEKVHASLQDLLALSQEVREHIRIMHYGDNLGEYYTQIKESGLNIALRGQTYEFEIPTGLEGLLEERMIGLCSTEPM